MDNFVMEIGPEVLNNPNEEENRVNWILMNNFMNGSAHDSIRATDYPKWKPYNWMEEAMSWARGEDYFPNMTDDEILKILRKYEAWNKFEEAYHV